MKHTTTIRTELLNFMKHNDLNINQLSKVTGLNAGSISTMVNGNRALSVEQLDRITTAMGYSKGYFYEQYIEEYLVQIALNWRRIKPFLYRCAELDKQECIRQVIGLLLDKLMYSSYLFDLAEEFFKDGNYTIAAILYEDVGLSEKNQHSERLALCQYRLFMARQGDNQEKNYQAAIEFQPFVDRLDEVNQLDALKDLANTYVNRLMSGEVGVLQEYVAYIEPRRNEIFSALVNIIEAANRFNLDIDDILQRFELEIADYIQQQQQAVGFYTRQHISEQFTRFLHELAFYYLSKSIFSDGFKYLLICLDKSSIINNKTCVIKCVGSFEAFREHASSETKTAYQKLIKEVCANEKKNRVNFLGD